MSDRAEQSADLDPAPGAPARAPGDHETAEHAARARIAPAELSNFRDLGGIAAGDGFVRHGVLWRSDDVSFIPDAQARDLIERGLTTLIDLRSDQERRATGRGVLESRPVAYHHIPLTDHMALPEALASAVLRGATFAEIGRWYADMVAQKTPGIVRALEVIASAEGATLFHCSAGKDRTGVLAAVVLTVLGVEPAEIVADYGRTQIHLERTRARLRPLVRALIGTPAEAAPPRDGKGHAVGDARPPTLGAHPESMWAMLTELEARGGIVAPLAAAGLTDETRSRLRARLVDGAP